MYCIIILRTSEDKIVRKKNYTTQRFEGGRGKRWGLGGRGGGRSCTVGLLFHTVW